MKLRVTLTRQPNFDIDDFDFLTEDLLQEEKQRGQLKNGLNTISKSGKKPQGQYKRGLNPDDHSAQKKPKRVSVSNPTYSKPNTTNYTKDDAIRISKDLMKPQTSSKPNVPAFKRRAVSNKFGNFDRWGGRTTRGDANSSNFTAFRRRRNPRGGAHKTHSGDFNVDYKDAQAPNQGEVKKAADNVQNTVEQVGGISGMFQWLMDQIANIPGWMQSIGGYLKELWGKIKGWMSRFHIFDRVRSFSKLTIACVGFVALTVANWIYKVIFKNRDNYNATKYDDAIANRRSTISTNWQQFKNPTAETAVFIETLGEILREDSNGGAFMGMIQGAFRKGGKTANVACTACSNSSNSNLRRIGGFLKSIIDNVRVALGGTPTAESTIPNRFRRRLYNETAFEFDDSLTSFYESIILEAQAHKLKEIKKKAKKKVAIKQAKAKRSLRGRI